jgi:hypothetical protein
MIYELNIYIVYRVYLIEKVNRSLFEKVIRSSPISETHLLSPTWIGKLPYDIVVLVNLGSFAVNYINTLSSIVEYLCHLKALV